MSHSYAPAPAHTTRGSTCVTCKWSMPLDIRPSHALPLCACVTPMHPLHCSAGSNHVTPHAGLIHGYTKLGQHIIFPWYEHHTYTRTCGIVQRAPPVSPATGQSHQGRVL
ncbi:hypothetical protein O181_009420 [Austropuccinia psidii MF-1]|uniref:Uncharacterized protein n=1 Tax=Austropuccinia psidii MF-1 TaxID=1389203 RepID=A0A9Q3GJW9_9BASI|nr:hypothetical protein [Austropuccinia psidii MF-1]